MPGPDRLSFPDGPRSELDKALAELVERAAAVANTQGRLRDLLHATTELIEETELPRVLRRIVEAAVALVDARYGAMGVIAPDGSLEQFIHVGMDADDVDGIGNLPRGDGLLGALIDDPTPIRLPHIAEDARSAGFPPNHPPMDSFLGVPVRVRDQVFGNLYLTQSAAGAFTQEDEQLLTSLATTAGFAIDNARLLDETRLRAAWTSAAMELTTRVLNSSEARLENEIARAISALVPGALICVIRVPDEGQPLLIDAVAGAGDGAQPGTALGRSSAIVEAVLQTGETQRIDATDAASDPTRLTDSTRSGPAIYLALTSPRGPWGVITIARTPDARRFDEVEVAVAADLADRVSVAVELVRARTFEERTMLLEDRGRIARDLHDHVIQDLFGTGLQLQALSTLVGSSEQAERLRRAVERIDDSIAQIRSIIFATSPLAGRATTPRHRIMDLAAELSTTRSSPISVRFTGPVDHSVDDDLLPDLIAVARELLSNAVRHAHAKAIAIHVGAESGMLTVTVRDDGVGMTAKTRESGLGNVAHRAEARDGRIVVESRPGATMIEWTVPLRAPTTEKRR